MININTSVLIVDDEQKICGIMKEILTAEGYEVHTALNGDQATEVIDGHDIDLVLLDIKLPDINGIELLEIIKKKRKNIPVIMISAFGTISLAVEALKKGAIDFLEKPLEANRALTTIRNALKVEELRRQSNALRSEIEDKYRIIGESPKIKKMFHMINKVAATNSTVLITGESGVGKELVARSIHYNSHRAGWPFIKVNCAALPGELIESELFGYEKGAFTGAYTRKTGQFELANRGTIFLDEIGDMSLAAQAKVLRVLEDGEILRLGSVKPAKIDVRIIAATNQDLDDLIKHKLFRDDLYHRINVIKIEVTPLRKRSEDIPLLAKYFLANACVENNRQVIQLSANALKYLKDYNWPGNVRELKHLMEKLAVLSDENTIDVDGLKILFTRDEQSCKDQDNSDMAAAKSGFEKNHIIEVLDQTNWHISKAAKILNIDRSTLFRKMKKLNIKQQ